MISTPTQRSTAADQPAQKPENKITWFWGGGWGGHDKHTRSTAADASFTPEAFTGPTFGSRTMGHHFVLALCVAYVLLLRVACAPCPIVDSWFQAFWTCDPFLLDAHFEVFAGSSDPFARFAASVGATSARSPLSVSAASRNARVLASGTKCCYFLSEATMSGYV